MKENFRGVKVRWLTKAVAIFLELKEVEYSMIWYNKRNKSSKKAYPEQKTYQNNVWHQNQDLKKISTLPFQKYFLKNINFGEYF